MDIMKYKSCLFISNLFIVLFPIFCYSQETFDFTLLDKTPNVRLYSVEADHLGYVWMASNNGIYKFTGYDYFFTSCEEIFNTSTTINTKINLKKDKFSNLWISANSGELTKIDSLGAYTIYKDGYLKKTKISTITSYKGNVWFGTNDGFVLRYNYQNSVIDSIAKLPKIKEKNQNITSLAFTSADDAWISTDTNDIIHYDLKLKIFTPLNLLKSTFNQRVKLTSDKKGKLWISTEQLGLKSYNPITKTTHTYGIVKTKNKTNIYAQFSSLFCDNNGIIWAGTDGDGLYRINPETYKIKIYKHKNENKHSISSNTIISINEDSQGNIWLIDKKGYINILPNSNHKIKYYSGLENNRNVEVLSILKSSDNSLWLGTDGDGLSKLDSKNRLVTYTKDKKGEYYFEGEYIEALVEDSENNIWIDTYKNGLWIYDKNRNSFSKIENPNDSSTPSMSNVNFIFKDSKDRLWVAFPNALSVFTANRELLATFNHNSNELNNHFTCFNICEDENNIIWVSSKSANLLKFNESNDFKSSYFINVASYKKHNYNGILSIKSDLKGSIWILTNSGSLIKYSIKKNSSHFFLNESLFKGLLFSSILIENNENIWLSGRNGDLHHYKTDNETLNSYYHRDGLKVKKFKTKSTFKDKNGMLYFGGEGGVNAFYPNQISRKKNNAKLYINNIKILNKPIKYILKEQSKTSNEHIKNLILKASQSSFSFKFSAIDNVLNANYHYSYRLKGYENDWIVPNNELLANYTNIPHGSYTFEVKAGSKVGVYDIKPIQLHLKIKPFWWNTYWAYIVYIVLFLYIIYSIINRVRLKNRLLKETLIYDKEKEVYALKMNFFAKMSHEIQTPLTLILAPIEDMLLSANFVGNKLLENRLVMIKNNAKRLSRLAIELMTIRNKEINKLRIYASKTNLITDLKKIASSFSEQARFKGIDFFQEYEYEQINIWYDTDKIEHVIYNLLSNAFKFTPREGKIILKASIDKTNETVIISIIDSGPGIPNDELNDIFKLFYQSNLGKNTKGTGIGLALAKELISLHHGEIKVSSSPENGTNFSVLLSTNKAVFSEDEKILIEDTSLEIKSTNEDFKSLKKQLNQGTNNTSKKTHTLLIVDDNIEMQMFLRDVLHSDYNLLIAENGKIGVDLAQKNNPDVIITDVMMPEMNGFEMCKTLQKKKSTSHIPIIILTAKNDNIAKIKGLKLGAIEYINKPFQFQELALKINNIIVTKEKALSRYETNKISSPKTIITIPSRDDIFMEKLIKELKSQIENDNFKLEELPKSLNMSYSVIYKKCQDITGKNLIDFFRSFKLKRAALMIAKGNNSISEVSYMVGFNNPKYFTKCFKKEFGITPSSFKNETQKIGEKKLLKKYKIIQ